MGFGGDRKKKKNDCESQGCSIFDRTPLACTVVSTANACALGAVGIRTQGSSQESHVHLSRDPFLCSIPTNTDDRAPSTPSKRHHVVAKCTGNGIDHHVSRTDNRSHTLLYTQHAVLQCNLLSSFRLCSFSVHYSTRKPKHRSTIYHDPPVSSWDIIFPHFLLVVRDHQSRISTRPRASGSPPCAAHPVGLYVGAHVSSETASPLPKGSRWT